jgi:ferredoxin
MSAVTCLATLTPLARDAAVSPELVVYDSRGTVLVLGDDAEVAEIVERVALHHATVVFAPGVDKRAFGAGVTAVGRRVTHVRGYLGTFQAEIHSPSGVTDIGAASPNPGRHFDIVLDLGLQPVLRQEVAPLGYFSPGLDAATRQAAITAIQGLVGRFTKPRYFSYQPDICAHGASGLQGCTRCLDVCSAQAIASAGTTIRVDPHLCQGCATCSLSCPTGALSFRFPSREILGERMEKALGSGAGRTTLVVHGKSLDTLVQSSIAEHGAVAFVIDPLPAFGDELWLRALALGAQALVLVHEATLPEKTRALMASCVAQMHTMLPALGLAQDRLVWLSEDELPRWLAARSQAAASPGHAHATNPPGLPPIKAWARYKRLAWLDALRLQGRASNATAVVGLARGASFGEVRVDGQRCTLCFACTGLCPTGALVAKDDAMQRLLFQESACVQCGLCVEGCPEKALSLHARMAPSIMVHMTSTVLHQDSPFECQSCATPFISRRLLASSLERLKDHPVMAKGGRESLMTCPACRQREMMSHQ